MDDLEDEASSWYQNKHFHSLVEGLVQGSDRGTLSMKPAQHLHLCLLELGHCVGVEFNMKNSDSQFPMFGRVVCHPNDHTACFFILIIK